MQTLRISTHAVAVGGDAIGRTGDGKVVFVDAALPGEELDVEITEDRKDFAKGRVVALHKASPDRMLPTCPHVARGCGGCGWQHVVDKAQPVLKKAIVVDSLVRIGRIRNAAELVESGPALVGIGHRTTVRVAIADGRAGFREARSHRVVTVDSCMVAHPVLERLMTEGQFGSASEVSFRLGTSRNGRSLVTVVVEPDATEVRLPEIEGYECTVIGADEVAEIAATEADLLEAMNREATDNDNSEDVDGSEDADGSDSASDDVEFPDRPATSQVVSGVELQVSVGSFFQTRLDGAELLVDLVDGALGGSGSDDRDMLIDLYGGVGLFAATIGQDYATVVSVESNPVASADAVENLADHHDANVVCEDVDRWRPPLELFDGRDVSVVADPSRKGLGRYGVESIVRLDPFVIVLVSCDAASLGRDARLLTESGYTLQKSYVVDLFPHTPHVEVVSRFIRAHDGR